MKIKYAAVMFFVFALNVLAQPVKKEVIDDISTDRPDQSESPLLVPKGFFQFEFGWSKEKVGKIETITTGPLTINQYSTPSMLWRYGLTQNVELRFGAEYLVSHFITGWGSTEIEDKGIPPLSVGTKIFIAREKGALPDMALILSLSLPVFDNVYKSEYIGTEFRFAMAHSLGERFSLSYNLGGAWDGNQPNATGLYTLALGASIVNRLGAFAEVYGFLPQKSEPDHRFDTGFTYLIAKNIQADVLGGFGISKNAPDYFISAGLSFRLPK